MVLKRKLPSKITPSKVPEDDKPDAQQASGGDFAAQEQQEEATPPQKAKTSPPTKKPVEDAPSEEDSADTPPEMILSQSRTQRPSEEFEPDMQLSPERQQHHVDVSSVIENVATGSNEEPAKNKEAEPPKAEEKGEQKKVLESKEEEAPAEASSEEPASPAKEKPSRVDAQADKQPGRQGKKGGKKERAPDKQVEPVGEPEVAEEPQEPAAKQSKDSEKNTAKEEYESLGKPPEEPVVNEEDKVEQKTEGSTPPWVSEEADHEDIPAPKNAPNLPEIEDIDDLPVSTSSNELPELPPLPGEGTSAPETSKEEAPSSLADDIRKQAVSSKLPWAQEGDAQESNAADDDWQIEDIVGEPSAKPTDDVYKNIEEDVSDTGLPPWAQPAGGDGDPPELPGEGGNAARAQSALPKEMLLRNLAVLAVVVGVLFGVYQLFFTKKEKTNEVLARWSGTLNEVSQEIPDEPSDIDVVAALEEEPVPEKVITFKPKEEVEPEVVIAETKPERPAEEGRAVEEKEQAEETHESEEGSPVKEAVQTEGSEDMPEDVSLFASLQRAIVKAKEEKRKEGAAKAKDEIEEIDPETLSDEELQERNVRIQAELESELEAYKKALANAQTPLERPSPGKFFEQPEKYAGQQAVSIGKPRPLPDFPTVGVRGGSKARQSQAQQQEEDVLPQNKVLDQNPYNLPVIGEPKMPEQKPVRTLEDFDVTMFEPEKPRVRIPKKIRPIMRSTTFPGLEILSLVPNKGIIATSGGKEGVLLLGEMLNGWELVDVTKGYAEFSNGVRKHVVPLPQ